MLRLQPRANVLLGRPRKPIGAGRPQYQCGRCPRLLSLAAGARHKLKPSAVPPDYNAEHKLGSRRIWAWQVRIVQRTSLRCVQPAEGRIARNEDIRVMAESLQAAVPNVSMNVII